MTIITSVVSGGHPGSGRDGRRGDRARTPKSEPGTVTLGGIEHCMHGYRCGDINHDCLTYENVVRQLDGRPLLECYYESHWHGAVHQSDFWSELDLESNDNFTEPDDEFMS